MDAADIDVEVHGLPLRNVGVGAEPGDDHRGITVDGARCQLLTSSFAGDRVDDLNRNGVDADVGEEIGAELLDEGDGALQGRGDSSVGEREVLRSDAERNLTACEHGFGAAEPFQRRSAHRERLRPDCEQDPVPIVGPLDSGAQQVHRR